MAELVVREMTRPEFGAWRGESIRSYARSNVAAGTWPADEADERSTAQYDQLLPDGYDTGGMVFLTAELTDGTPVGTLWLCLTTPRGTPDCAFIYNIEIGEAHRGAGHGRALLAAAEDAARARGSTALELNVFGHNTPAVRLYETSGYAVVTQQMRKSLA